MLRTVIRTLLYVSVTNRSPCLKLQFNIRASLFTASLSLASCFRGDVAPRRRIFRGRTFAATRNLLFSTTFPDIVVLIIYLSLIFSISP